MVEFEPGNWSLNCLYCKGEITVDDPGKKIPATRVGGVWMHHRCGPDLENTNEVLSDKGTIHFAKQVVPELAPPTSSPVIW